MKAPETYFEWKEMLDRFGRGDDSLMQFLNQGKMALDAGTAVRYHQLVNDTYVKRKQLWLDKFKTITQNQVAKSASDFGVHINQAKTGLRILIDFTRCNALPEDLKKVFREDLTSFVGEVKKSLRENIQKSRSNQMNTLLLAIENLDIHKVESNISTATEDSPPNKRRIIF